ncbi:hypothetical protein NDU88_004959 [Pleurodeles waltl]|uniref:Uncharacterized protein n=1 Tax=Pleurodeles waltl TaxID=8319 RepID=A0AAV7WZC3_PLEWA|nr:hypothetical protein NDU88_004959 [Pleurodeles waltl]
MSPGAINKRRRGREPGTRSRQTDGGSVLLPLNAWPAILDHAATENNQLCRSFRLSPPFYPVFPPVRALCVLVPVYPFLLPPSAPLPVLSPVPGMATLLLKRGGSTRVLPGASGLRPRVGTVRVSATVGSPPKDSGRLLLLLFRGRPH